VGDAPLRSLPPGSSGTADVDPALLDHAITTALRGKFRALAFMLTAAVSAVAGGGAVSMTSQGVEPATGAPVTADGQAPASDPDPSKVAAALERLEATRCEGENVQECERAILEARRALDFFEVLADSCELPHEARPRPRPLPRVEDR
jgi:hypothetical protein